MFVDCYNLLGLLLVLVVVFGYLFVWVVVLVWVDLGWGGCLVFWMGLLSWFLCGLVIARLCCFGYDWCGWLLFGFCCCVVCMVILYDVISYYSCWLFG